jgi:hypothetical protein
MKRIILICGLFLPLLMVGSALATPIIFTSTNGEATINFMSPTQMTVMLENTGTVTAISSVLDGFSFTFSAAPSNITLENGVTFGGTAPFLVCTSGTCIPDNPGINLPAHGGWNVSGTLTTPLLVAGTGFHPYGIVNDSIDGSLDGLRNPQHNPYLNGPVTFTLDLTGLLSIPDITAANFYFGTTPDVQPGNPDPVPEPATMLLLGSGMIGLVGLRRKFKK